jgi:ribosomal protein S18 acetylase RimI-like enzyme
MSDKFERMIQLVTEFFDVKNDPDQLSVDEKVMEKLNKIHPSCMSEYNEGDGPIVWILLIPTTEDIMKRFLAKEISETQLLNETPIGGKYDAIYLCSASVLPEYRRKGLAKKVGYEAIQSIMKDHKIKVLFYWSFSPEGQAFAEKASKELNLPLYKR